MTAKKTTTRKRTRTASKKAPAVKPPAVETEPAKQPDAAAAPDVAQQLDSIRQVADALQSDLGAQPETPDPPKRKRGRPRKAETQLAQQQAESAAKAQRVGILSAALTTTIGGMVEHYEMAPPFTSAQGDALAMAWDPVILLYMKETGPLPQAVMTTLVVMLPYILQGAARVRNRAVNKKKNAQPKRVIGGPAGGGENAAGDPAS